MASLKFDIEISKQVKKIPLSISKLEEISKKILKELKWKQVSLSVVLVGDQRIKTLNKQYLKHDWVTDVIAFPQHKKVRPGKKPLFLGDLAICVPTARRQAKTFETTFKYELCFYLCHGILHLMGYDDKTKNGAAWMLKTQYAILKKIGIK